MNEIPDFPCHIKELNISCFGCCGNKFSSKEKIEEDIKLNTQELLVLGKKLDSEKLKMFRDRFDGENALSLTGLCYNFVDFGSGCQACPLHFKANELKPKNFELENKEDLRIGHCDINEECESFKGWKTMSDSDKLKFISWVKKEKYDSYSYSVENGAEKLFKKYLKSI